MDKMSPEEAKKWSDKLDSPLPGDVDNETPEYAQAELDQMKHL